jgi:hypothetical protein
MKEENNQSPKNTAARYKLNWIDHLTTWIRKLPGTIWGYYFGLGLFLLLGQVLVLWIEGGEIIVSLHSVQIFLPVAIVFILAIIPYFNDRALSALETIKPALSVAEDQYKIIAYRLANLPAGSSVLVSVLFLLYVFISETIGGGAYQVYPLEDYPISMAISRGLYLICWWCFATFCYHTIHQLRLINYIYTNHTQIDLFHMKPLYGFSNLTALKAGSLVLLPIGFLFLNPTTVILNDPIVLGFYLVISLIAFLTFLLPQLGIHRLQNDEKDRLLDEINRRYKTSMSQIHTFIDEGKNNEAVALRNVLGTLEEEKKVVKSFSTWPWQPETLRWLFTAMVLPLLLWFAQYFLGQWLDS